MVNQLAYTSPITRWGFFMTSEELLQQQLAEISEQQAAKTKPVELPKDIGIRYNAELQRMVKSIQQEINKSIVPQLKYLAPEYTADSWVDTITSAIALLRQRLSGDNFKRYAERLATSFITDINTRNIQTMGKQFGSFGIDIMTNNKQVTDFLQASIAENVQLITSIQSQYLDRVETLVLTNMRAGLRPSAIQQQLQDQFGVTKTRARMIARDQTSKATNGLARKRMQASGLEYFRWLDSSDQRVRARHRSISNKITMYGKGIYKFSDLPLNDKGEPIFCGDEVNCRCVPIPILPSEVERNQKQGLVAKGVKK